MTAMTLRAIAENGDFAEDTFTLRVEGQPQIAKSIPFKTVVAEKQSSFFIDQDTFVHPNGDQLIYEARINGHDVGVNETAWIRFNQYNNAFIVTPPRDALGVLPIEIIAKDPKQQEVSQFFNLYVIQSITAPESVKVGKLLNFVLPQGTFGGIANTSYTAALVNGTEIPSWLKFDAQSLSFSGVATTPNLLDIMVTATYPNRENSKEDFLLTIIPLYPPVLVTPIADVRANAEEKFELVISRFTFDGEDLVFAMEGLPAWAKFDNTTLKVFGTPTFHDTGFYYDYVSPVKLIASEAGAKAECKFKISVGGVSIEEKMLNVAWMLLGATSAALAMYKNRYLLFNSINKGRYIKPDEVVIAGESYHHEFNVNHHLACAVRAKIKKEQKRCGGYWSYFFSESKGFASAKPLPFWLKYNKKTCTLESHLVPKDLPYHALQIEITDKDNNQILEQFTLKIEHELTEVKQIAMSDGHSIVEDKEMQVLQEAVKDIKADSFVPK